MQTSFWHPGVLVLVPLKAWLHSPRFVSKHKYYFGSDRDSFRAILDVPLLKYCNSKFG